MKNSPIMMPNTDGYMAAIPEVWRSDIFAARWIDDKLYCVQEFAFTGGLLVDVAFFGLTYDYKARYCYPKKHEAIVAIVLWDGEGDPPLNWAKEKLSERLGPALLKDA